MTLRRMDNVLINVENIEAAEAFFAELGMEKEGQTTVEGAWAGKVIGLDNVRADITMMKTPDGHGRVELSRFHTPPAIRAEPEDTPAKRARHTPHHVRRPGHRRRPRPPTQPRCRTSRRNRAVRDQVRLRFVRGPEGVLIGLAEELQQENTPPNERSTREPAVFRTN